MSKNTEQKRVRRPVDEAHSKILAAALDSVSQFGWMGLSFQSIAKKCKMSTSNIVYHFENRPALLKALLDEISKNNYDMVAQAIRPEHDALERLVIHCQKNLEWAQKFPHEAQIILQIYLEAANDKEFSGIFLMMITRAQTRILEHLLAGQREGIFSLPADPPLVARFIHNFLIGAIGYTVGYSRDKKSVEYKLDEVKTLLSALIGHQKPHPGKPR